MFLITTYYSYRQSHKENTTDEDIFTNNAKYHNFIQKISATRKPKIEKQHARVFI